MWVPGAQKLQLGQSGPTDLPAKTQVQDPLSNIQRQGNLVYCQSLRKVLFIRKYCITLSAKNPTRHKKHN